MTARRCFSSVNQAGRQYLSPRSRPPWILCGASMCSFVVSAPAAACASSSAWTDAPLPANPLLKGVPRSVVDRYVDEILADPNLNIRSIPDPVERILYNSTVTLVLDLLYYAFSNLHGLGFLGHHLEISLAMGSEQDSIKLGQYHDTGSIDIRILETIAQELLDDPAINVWWIPDFMEKQIYVNCLKLMIRLLDHLSSTIAIDIAGHELSLSFEPCAAVAAAKLVAAHGSCSTPSSEPSRHNYDPAAIDELVEHSLREVRYDLSWWGLLPGYERFVKGIQRTLYSLILGIVDNILQTAQIDILSERITIKLVADDHHSVCSVLPKHDADLEASTIGMQEELAMLRQERDEAVERARSSRNLATLPVDLVGCSHD